MFKAKPARKVIKARPVKAAKDALGAAPGAPRRPVAAIHGNDLGAVPHAAAGQLRGVLGGRRAGDLHREAAAGQHVAHGADDPRVGARGVGIGDQEGTRHQ